MLSIRFIGSAVFLSIVPGGDWVFGFPKSAFLFFRLNLKVCQGLGLVVAFEMPSVSGADHFGVDVGFASVDLSQWPIEIVFLFPSDPNIGVKKQLFQSVAGLLAVLLFGLRCIGPLELNLNLFALGRADFDRIAIDHFGDLGGDLLFLFLDILLCCGFFGWISRLPQERICPKERCGKRATNDKALHDGISL